MLQRGNPMGKVMTALLLFEAITIGLAIPVMIMVSGVSPGVAAGAGGAGAVLAFVAASMMRTPRTGYPLGWLTQVGALALSFLTIGMLIMGAMFATLWIVCFVLGRRLEAQREMS
ncbi:MAG: DUF4233 domain-containing protein [Propionibacteriaceae bacterium]|nr:DUF4233 domain-containing protein [Propionibacteriaceae bacterium]